jgi:hypothetical protein
VADVLGEVAESSRSLLSADRCAMRLEDIARAGLVVEVWSEVLGYVMVMPSDDACVDPGELRAVVRSQSGPR